MMARIWKKLVSSEWVFLCIGIVSIFASVLIERKDEKDAESRKRYLFLSRNLNAGSKITFMDLNIRASKKEISDALDDQELQLISNVRLKTDVAAGEPLLRSQIEPLDAVETGSSEKITHGRRLWRLEEQDNGRLRPGDIIDLFSSSNSDSERGEVHVLASRIRVLRVRRSGTWVEIPTSAIGAVESARTQGKLSWVIRDSDDLGEVNPPKKFTALRKTIRIVSEDQQNATEAN